MKISARLLALPLLMFGLFLTGCDSDSDNDDANFEGTYEAMNSDEPGDFYLEVNSSDASAYTYSDEGRCYQLTPGSITDKESDALTVSWEEVFIETPETTVFTITGDVLNATSRLYGQRRFERYDVDISSLEICEDD